MSEIDQVRQQLRQERARQLREENEAAIAELDRQQREREYLTELGHPLSERREWRLPEAEPPPRERKRDTSPVDWSSVIDQRIAAEHEFVAQVIAEIVATLADRQAEAIDDALRPLRVELADLRISNAELRLANTELRKQMSAGYVVDLPALPLCGGHAN